MPRFWASISDHGVLRTRGNGLHCSVVRPPDSGFRHAGVRTSHTFSPEASGPARSHIQRTGWPGASSAVPGASAGNGRSIAGNPSSRGRLATPVPIVRHVQVEAAVRLFREARFEQRRRGVWHYRRRADRGVPGCDRDARTGYPCTLLPRDITRASARLRQRDVEASQRGGAECALVHLANRRANPPRASGRALDRRAMGGGVTSRNHRARRYSPANPSLL